MKVITVCGSFKFKKEMLEVAEELSLQGNCMILPNFPVRGDKTSYTAEELQIFASMHKEKIRVSDAILVVDIDGYIGETTTSEIEFAKELKKEVIYYSNLVNLT